MPPLHRRTATLETVVRSLRAGVQNAASLVPGEKPAWVVVDITGALSTRSARPHFFGLPLPQSFAPERGSLEELSETLASLSDARWLEGVLFRIDGVHAEMATLYGLRRAIARVRRRGKATAAYVQRIDWINYYLASATDQVIAPESADVSLNGLGVSVTFVRDALARFGVRFEKLAIDEYKSAFDNLVRQDMSPANREQLDALLARIDEHFTVDVGQSRGIDPGRVRDLVDMGLTSTAQAKENGLVDRIAYEDEVIGKTYRPLDEARRFLQLPIPAPGGKRIAVVSLLGGIVSGTSRHAPVPLPPFESQLAGSESIVRALRVADADPSTAAIVFFVDSGGGSALASDLIWREVRRIRDRKPIVAVMGGVAASGGYYVLTHATRVIAAPTTITGSIGVLTGKLTVDELFDRHGLHAEFVRRGRFAFLHHPAMPFGDDERALLGRHNEEVYQRFVARVADGRGLSAERVNEIGRGRVWAGADALKVGLVDELGDINTAIERARELGNVGARAPVWDVSVPREVVLPTADDPTTMRRWASMLAGEKTLLVCPIRCTFG